LSTFITADWINYRLKGTNGSPVGPRPKETGAPLHIYNMSLKETRINQDVTQNTTKRLKTTTKRLKTTTKRLKIPQRDSKHHKILKTTTKTLKEIQNDHFFFHSFKSAPRKRREKKATKRLIDHKKRQNNLGVTQQDNKET